MSSYYYMYYVSVARQCCVTAAARGSGDLVRLVYDQVPRNIIILFSSRFLFVYITVVLMNVPKIKRVVHDAALQIFKNNISF